MWRRAAGYSVYFAHEPHAVFRLVFDACLPAPLRPQMLPPCAYPHIPASGIGSKFVTSSFFRVGIGLPGGLGAFSWSCRYDLGAHICMRLPATQLCALPYSPACVRFSSDPRCACTPLCTYHLIPVSSCAAPRRHQPPGLYSRRQEAAMRWQQRERIALERRELRERAGPGHTGAVVRVT